MSRRERRQEPEDGGGGDWLTTYSDLVTLLLCFFVLLFSMSEVDAEKFRQLSESLRVSFDGGSGVLEDQPPAPELPDIDLEIDELIGADDDLKDLYQQLKEYAEEQGVGDEVSVGLEERGIILRFKDNVLFDSGSADLKSVAYEILDAAAEILNQKEFKSRHIKVEGHSDSDPIVHQNKYDTNWELSSGRATNVLRYLVETKGVDGERLSSSGYGEFRPIAPNDTPLNKSKNRRVDLVVLTDKFEDYEPDGGLE